MKGVTIDAANTLLRQVRRRYDVAGLNLGGINLWPLVRLAVLYTFIARSRSLAITDKGDNWRPRRLDRRVDLSDAILFGAPPAKSDLLLLQSHKDFTLKSSDGLLDPLAEGLLKLDAKIKISYLSSIGHSSLSSPQASLFLYQEKDRAATFPDAELDAFLTQLWPISSAINDATETTMVSPMDVLAWSLRIHALIPAYRALFRAFAPNVIMMQSYLGLEKLAALAAAKSENILTVDHQHGMFTKDAEVYISWIEAPPGIIDPTPDWFWVWSDWFLDRMPDPTLTTRAITGGDLRARRASLVPEKAGSLRKGRTRTVLFLHQPYGDSPSAEDQGTLPFLLLSLIREAPEEWVWLIRLHPRYRTLTEHAEQSLEGNENVLVREPTETSLTACIEAADVALTGSSAAAFDAIDAGLPTVFTEEAVPARLGSPIDPELMIYARDLRSVLDALANTKRKPANPRFVRRDRNLAIGSLQTILDTIEAGKG